MALTFDANYYLSARPDVFNAFVKANGSTGLTWAQFAENHYNTFGRFEGSNPNSVFNTTEYLTANPDVAAAGVNPFQHFLTFGVNEGRSPNASFPTFASFDSATYLSSNPDLAAAGITTKAQAWAHFVVYGEFEGRPGAPVVDNGIAGSTFTLTTNVDSLVGTATNDVFNGVNGTTNTLTVADALDGKGGVDTLNVILDANGSVFPAATIKNIENIFVRDLADGTTVSAATIEGEQQLWNDRSTGAIAFTNVAAGTTVGVKGDGTTAVAATTFAMASGTDAVSIAFDGGIKGANGVSRLSSGEAAVTISSTGAANTVGAIDLDNAGSNIKAVTINATGALTASLVAADYAAAASVTVKGGALVDLSGAALAAAITKVDASAMTAGGVSVKVDQTNVVVDTQFIGGKGDDTLDVGTVVYDSTTLTAVGGDGKDTIKMSDQAALTSTTAKYISGFETLSLYDDNDGALDTFDVSLLSGVTSITLAADSAGDGYSLTNLSAAQAAAITISGTQAVGPTFGVKDATVVGNLDTLSIAINDGAAAKNTITLANVNAAGVETVNFANTDNLTLTSATGLAAVTKIGITGAGNTDITTGSLAVNVNTVVDASASTGTFTFVGTGATANGLAIKGSATADNTITGTAQNDVITGGTGIDIVKHTGGTDTANLVVDSKADIIEFVNLTGRLTVSNFDVATATTTEDLVNVSNNNVDGGEVVVTASAAQSALTADRTYVVEQKAGAAAAVTTGGTATITDFTNATQVAAYLAERFTVAGNNETALVFLNDGTSTFTYSVDASAGAADGVINAAEVSLVGVFNGAVLNNGDIYQTV